MVSIASLVGGGAVVAITIKAIDEFSSTLDKATSQFGTFGATASKLAVGALAATATAIAAVGIASVKLAGDFEQTQVAFTTMLGSAEAAEGMLKDLADFAVKTPFTITGVEEQAKKLLAYGIASEDVLTDLKALGDIAAGVGTEKLPQLTLAFGQVSAAGKLRGQEVRQFTEAGVPILEELSRHLGVATTEIQDMVSAGEVGFEDVRAALMNLTSEGGRFENLMAKQALTFEGMISNLQDTLTLFGRDIGKELLPQLKELVGILGEDILPTIKVLVPPFVDFITLIIKELTPYLPRLSELLIRVVDVFMRLFTAISPIIDPLLDLFFLFTDLILDVLEPIIPLIELLANIISKDLAFAFKILEPILNVVTDLFAGLMYFLEPVLDLIGDAYDALSDFFGLTKTKSKVEIDTLSSLKSIKLNDFILSNGKMYEPNESDTIIGTKNPNAIGNGITIYITGDNYGVDAEQIAEAISVQIKNKINI